MALRSAGRGPTARTVLQAPPSRSDISSAPPPPRGAPVERQTAKGPALRSQRHGRFALARVPVVVVCDGGAGCAAAALRRLPFRRANQRPTSDRPAP